jgi:hypothetical protein
MKLMLRCAAFLTEVAQVILYWLGGGNGDPERLRAADARRRRAGSTPKRPARSSSGRGPRKR